MKTQAVVNVQGENGTFVTLTYVRPEKIDTDTYMKYVRMSVEQLEELVKQLA